MKLPKQNEIAFEVKIEDDRVNKDTSLIVKKGKRSVYRSCIQYGDRKFSEHKRYNTEAQAIEAATFRAEKGYFPEKEQLEN